jgi:hypothetical protein
MSSKVRIEKDSSGNWIRGDNSTASSDTQRKRKIDDASDSIATILIQKTLEHKNDLLAKAEAASKANKHLLQPYEDSENKRAQNCDLPISKTAKSEMQKMGFMKFLSMRHKDTTLPTLLNFFGQFISFVKDKERKSLDNLKIITAVGVFLYTIQNKNNLLHFAV